jgi:dipeptidyl aminopeptidase/acylaminoacyl peptidase
MTNTYRFEQFAAVRQFQPTVAYSPDGSRIAYVDNTSGQMNLWLMPTGGGEPRQLTSFTDHAVREVAWSPDGTRIAFYADHDSDERHQIYIISADGGEPVKLTAAEKAQHTFMGNPWSPDGKTLAYSANDRDPAIVEVILHNVETGETRRPIKPKNRYYPVAWSPDGEYITLWARMPGMDENIVLMHVSGDNQIATQHDGNDIRCTPGPWTHDGSSFYMLTDQEHDFKGLARYLMNFNRWEWVKIADYDLEFVKLSKDDRYLIWCQNEHGRSKLYGRDLYREIELKLPDLPQGVVKAMSISPDGNRLALILDRAVEAATLVEVNIASGDVNTLTKSMLGGINPADMIEPELVTFDTFDGRKIPAWLFRPKNMSGKHPALLSVHGGPESQERPEYLHLGLYQYLAHKGIVVLCPNIRGSSGYGMSYQKLIRRDWGGAELKDIEHAAKYLQSLDYVDSSRIAMHGRSFGGFATLSACSRLPDYWVCGVDVVGPANLPTFLRATPPFWKSFIKQWCGDPDEDYDFLMSRSPFTYAENIKCPMLVIQGAKDPRVVKSESDQMVEKIRAAGGNVTYYVDEHSGHVPTQRENYYKWISMIAEYLERHLVGSR